MQGFMYKANHAGPHPTLILLHGYPGNERNLDLAQAVRAHGWNVIYFDYRGSWASQGEFSFRHCVEDVSSVYQYCKEHAAELQIDTSRIALFGHSMGGWVCLEALANIPGIRKGFALSTWDILGNLNQVDAAGRESMNKEADNYFVLHKSSGKALFDAVLADKNYHDLNRLSSRLADKQVFLLDEHHRNKELAANLQKTNIAYFNYEVWPTDHPFTNKRASLIKQVLAFLER
ncbi:MAG TPA: alpha/beta hydrolase, partial [Sediminibacterium sp.]|nr:alpha/beta hydrolase [Sediminibacterium sp.]